MDTSIINECKALSLAGKITFPEVVKKLIDIGVERYICDLVGLKLHYYSSKGEIYTMPLEYDADFVALNFNAAAVKEAVIEVQQNRIDYREFLRRVIAVGCCHYEVYISGKKVIYFGRDGSQHVELFPGAKP
jgi:uncharacterized protein YbcV (DUF1398 family)